MKHHWHALTESLRAKSVARLSCPGGSQRRSFRTAFVLAIVCVLNMFDLAFTQTQLARGNFAELNVLAAQAAQLHGPAGVTAYKVVLFGLGALILFRCRRHWESEAGAWVLLGCYGALMIWWVVYLKTVELCISDPAVEAPAYAF